MKSFFRLIRPLNCGMASLAVLIGGYLGGVNLLMPVILAMASAFLVSAGGMIVNDYYDRRLDSKFDPDKPIPSGKVSLKGASVLTFILFSIGLYLAFWINLPSFILAFVNSFLLVMYAKTLQKKFFISNLTVSFLVGSTFIYGGLAVGNPLPALLLGLMAFSVNTSREILKDVEDMYADVSTGIKSVPVVLDEEKSRLISSIFILAAVVLAPIPFVMGVFGWFYIFSVMPSVALFLYSVFLTFQDVEVGSIQRYLKLSMVLGLVAFLVGAF